MPGPGVWDVSRLESDGGDQFFCRGGRSGKMRAVRRPEYCSTLLVNTASTARVMIPAVWLDRAAFAVHVAGPHPVGKAAVGPGPFGLAHDLSGSYAASLCLCIGVQLASSLIILCAPRVVREPVSATERG